MKLIKDSSSDRYVFLCQISERFPARDAGFQFNNQAAPGAWSTDSARRALKLAAYADDELRAQIIRDAQNEPDPDRITLTFDGQTYRFHSPFAYKELAKQAGMQFAKHPRPCWWTADPETAIRCFNNAAQYEGLFECAAELRAQLENHLEQRNASLDASRALDAEIEIPCPSGLAYLPCQRAAIAYAVTRPSRGTLFADEMRIGKTPEVVGTYNALGLYTGIVYTPAALTIHWLRHFQDWATPRQFPNGFRLPTVGIASKEHWPDCDIVIVSFDKAGGEKLDVPAKGRRKASTIRLPRPEITRQKWGFVAVEEAHKITNKKTQRAQVIFATECDYKWPVSGTILRNKNIELQPLLAWICPDVPAFTDYWQYARRFCGMQKTPFGYDVSGSSHNAELQALMRQHCMIRRTRAEVRPELPPKRRQVIELPTDGLQSLIDQEITAQSYYETKVQELRLRAELAKASADESEYVEAVKALKRGRLAAFTEVSKARLATAMAKLPLVISHTQNVLEETDKVIVFAWHHEFIDTIRDALSGYGAISIDGRDSTDEKMINGVVTSPRQWLVDKFQRDPKCRVAVCAIKAAGVGYKLSAANTQIFGELDWVWINVTQAEDRGVAMDDTESLLIQHLVLADSLDGQMIRTMIRKQENHEQVLDRRGGIDLELDDVDTEFPEENLMLPEKALACTDESVQYSRPATYDVKREQVQREAEALSQKQIQLIHFGLRTLAGMCDGASSIDGAGFNKLDTGIGKALARCPALSGPQAALGKKILARYKNTQLKGMVDLLWQ